ncbi:hypothetical protein ACN47E_008824 [Coniothyrium glycines]
MTCREELPTRENRIGIAKLQHKAAIHAFCKQWPSYLQATRLRLRMERLRKLRNQWIQAVRQRRLMRCKVQQWLDQCEVLWKQLRALLTQSHADPTSVAPAEWESLTSRSRGKLQFMLGWKYPPREKWPAGVPYLNLIALRQLRGRSRWLKTHPRPSERSIPRVHALAGVAKAQQDGTDQATGNAGGDAAMSSS